MSFDDYTADQWREKHEAARRQWHEETTKLQEELKATQRELEYVAACSQNRDAENASLAERLSAAELERDRLGAELEVARKWIAADSVRIGELRVDRERLDWLATMSGAVSYEDGDEECGGSYWEVKVYPDEPIATGGTVREAIDAAMKEGRR